MIRRRRRVRVHLVEPYPEAQLPTLEGVLRRRWPEYELLIPTVTVAAGQQPHQLDARLAVIPRASVAFYEVIR